MKPRIAIAQAGRICIGVGTLALASPSHAAIVHIIAEPPFETNRTTGVADLDLDGNGQVDLQISNGQARLMLLPTVENRVVTDPGGLRVASLGLGVELQAMLDAVFYEWASTSRFGEDSVLGPSFQFCASNGAGRFCLGNFLTEPGFIGIEFDIDGALHYGWLLAVGHPNNVRSTIFEWAYEDVPGRPIAAGAIPEPSAVACSLVGFLWLLAHRRRNL